MKRVHTPIENEKVQQNATNLHHIKISRRRTRKKKEDLRKVRNVQDVRDGVQDLQGIHRSPGRNLYEVHDWQDDVHKSEESTKLVVRDQRHNGAFNGLELESKERKVLYDTASASSKNTPNEISEILPRESYMSAHAHDGLERRATQARPNEMPLSTSSTMSCTPAALLSSSSSPPPPVYPSYPDSNICPQTLAKSVPPCYYCSSPNTSFAAHCPINYAPISSACSSSSAASTCFASLESSMSAAGTCGGGNVGSDSTKSSKIFPSTRFFLAVLLCFCFISLSISTSNLSVSMVCMIRKADSVIATVNFDVDASANAYNYHIRRRKAGERMAGNSEGMNEDLWQDPPGVASNYHELIHGAELRDLNAEIMHLKRSLIGDGSNTVKNNATGYGSDSGASLSYINSTILLAQFFRTVEELSRENATLQYKPLRDSSASRTLSMTDNNNNNNNNNDSVSVLRVPVTLCKLARFQSETPVFLARDAAYVKKRDADTEYYDSNDGYDRSARVKKPRSYITVTIESCYEAGKMDWSSTDQGIVFAAQNAGSLLMLFTGTHADRLNGKWTIVAALLLLVISNALLPALAYDSVWLAVGARMLTGFSDAMLQPSANSMITRWFPPKERPFAVGLVTGGRQIGTLLILPVAGFLCSRHDLVNGWPTIFYLSALLGSVILVVWLLMAADKPSKHFCTSPAEQFYVQTKISEENVGKRTQRRAVPWRHIVTCPPIYAGVAALICHEYPLVIMLQLLPKYFNDVLKFPITTNGIISALPIAVLFISKTLSSSLSSLIGSRKKGRFVVSRTTLAKTFNAVASLGLAVCVAIVPLLSSEHEKIMAVVVLCLANAFAGLHTPGVQTALLQLAPAYTGIITGIAFGFVAIFGIINKILSNYIVQSGSVNEWMTVFWIAGIIAVLPVVFFTLWGSADRQHWATNAANTATAAASVSCPDFIGKMSRSSDEKLAPIIIKRAFTTANNLNIKTIIS